MRISRTTHFDATVDDVFAVVASEDHQQAKVATELGRSSAAVTDLGGGRTRVRTERVLPTRGMPAAVSSLVGDTLTVTEEQTWRPVGPDGTRSADLGIRVAGAPVQMRGTVTLSPAGEGSDLVVTGDLTCSVPILGRKIETAAKPTIEESFDHEVRLLSERLR
ncbi:DUF2505 domain-containing protein [Janibacter alittae]|uniref:DUF2505 domain-containing protein n=1 Tax=Janibacter alittae TaxID=3115209 RepID=A0ABZ2MES4_9MICO